MASSLHLNAKAKGLESDKRGVALSVETKDGETLQLPADKILVTVGRKPNTAGWGLENMAVDMEGRFVKVDDQCRTSMKNVWAVGDLVGEPMLEHKAAKQGEIVGRNHRGRKAALRSGDDCGCLLHGARDRQRRPVADG